MNRKGATLEGWMQGIMLAVLFVIIFTTVVVTKFNEKYGGNYTIEGLPTDTIQENFEEYQAGMGEKLQGGEASFTSVAGITLSTSWDILISTMSTIWYFIGAGWINTIVSYLRLPLIIAYILRGLFMVAIGFILLKILFKVKT